MRRGVGSVVGRWQRTVVRVELGYEWSGRMAKYDRAQVPRHMGFRECSTDAAAKLTEWLATGVCRAERRADRVRGVLTRCRAERIEPPSADRCDRIICSALYQAEKALARQVTARLGPPQLTPHPRPEHS